jgi:hypothetical protein
VTVTQIDTRAETAETAETVANPAARTIEVLAILAGIVMAFWLAVLAIDALPEPVPAAPITCDTHPAPPCKDTITPPPGGVFGPEVAP